MTGLIPNRLRLVTKKVCHEHIRATEERVQREDLQRWGNAPEIPQRMTMTILDDERATPIIKRASFLLP